MNRTCANKCEYAEDAEYHDGHFQCTHPAVIQIERLMHHEGDIPWPEDDGKLPENTPSIVTGTYWLGHPKDCAAYVSSGLDRGKSND